MTPEISALTEISILECCNPVTASSCSLILFGFNVWIINLLKREQIQIWSPATLQWKEHRQSLSLEVSRQHGSISNQYWKPKPVPSFLGVLVLACLFCNFCLFEEKCCSPQASDQCSISPASVCIVFEWWFWETAPGDHKVKNKSVRARRSMGMAQDTTAGRNLPFSGPCLVAFWEVPNRGGFASISRRLWKMLPFESFEGRGIKHLHSSAYNYVICWSSLQGYIFMSVIYLPDQEVITPE